MAGHPWHRQRGSRKTVGLSDWPANERRGGSFELGRGANKPPRRRRRSFTACGHRRVSRRRRKWLVSGIWGIDGKGNGFVGEARLSQEWPPRGLLPRPRRS